MTKRADVDNPLTHLETLEFLVIIFVQRISFTSFLLESSWLSKPTNGTLQLC